MPKRSWRGQYTRLAKDAMVTVCELRLIAANEPITASLKRRIEAAATQLEQAVNVPDEPLESGEHTDIASLP